MLKVKLIALVIQTKASHTFISGSGQIGMFSQ